MKKSVSIIGLLFVAILSFSAAAESSFQTLKTKLISTWVSDRISLDDDGLTGYMIPVLTFKADGTGSYSFKITANIDIESTESSTIKVSMAGNAPCTWHIDDSGVLHAYLDRKNFHMNISEKCFEVNPKDKEAKEYLETYKNELVQLLEDFKTEMIDILPEHSTWTDISIVGAKLYMTDSDGSKQTSLADTLKVRQKTKPPKVGAKQKPKHQKNKNKIEINKLI